MASIVAEKTRNLAKPIRRSPATRISKRAAALSLDVFETELGWFALIGDEEFVHAVRFGYRTKADAVQAGLNVCDGAVRERRWSSNVANRLRQFAAGEAQDFSDVRVATQSRTPFAERVLQACRRVRWGETATYGELAERAGSPNAARAVGSVMARNRCPIIVPCHRIVPSSGKLGGFSSPQGVSMKERLLTMEESWRA